MVVKKVNGVRIDDALELVLESLLGKEATESEMYGRGPCKERIAEVLMGLNSIGCLDVRIRTKGQKVPVYTLSEKGIALYCANRLRNEILASSRETDLNNLLDDELREPLEKRYAAQPDNDDGMARKHR